MKKLLFLMFVTSSMIAMQESPVFKLDTKGLEEFRNTKIRMVALAQIAQLPDSNKLLLSCKQLAACNDEQLHQIFAEDNMQKKIKEINGVVTTHPQYIIAYSDAIHIKRNCDEWRNFRGVNGSLIQNFLEKKGVKYPGTSSAADYIQANEKLEPQIISYITAGSFLIYYVRQMQRTETGQELAPLKFN